MTVRLLAEAPKSSAIHTVGKKPASVAEVAYPTNKLCLSLLLPSFLFFSFPPSLFFSSFIVIDRANQDNEGRGTNGSTDEGFGIPNRTRTRTNLKWPRKKKEKHHCMEALSNTENNSTIICWYNLCIEILIRQGHGPISKISRRGGDFEDGGKILLTELSHVMDWELFEMLTIFLRFLRKLSTWVRTKQSK